MHVLQQELIFVDQIIRIARFVPHLSDALVSHRFHHVLGIDVSEQIKRGHGDNQFAHAGGGGFHVL
ncbi:hypothetical protein D3C81_1599110 [compost metagenome]